MGFRHLRSFRPFSVGPAIFAKPVVWHMYDANTGAQIATFTKALAASFAQAGTVVYGPDGTMYIYFLNGAAGWLAMWNSTKALVAANFIPNIPGSSVFLRNKPGTYDWSIGLQWNKTIPKQTVLDATGPLYPLLEA